MIEEIKKRLNAGETVVLECVDRVSFQQGDEFNKSLFSKGSDLIVDYIDEVGGVKIKWRCYPDRSYIRNSQLKYFKIKEDEAATFNDLIDVASQAVKDNKIWLQFLSNDELSFYIEGCDSAIRYVARRNHKRISKEIDFIKSLYTETFVIESKVDLNKLKTNAVITLKNNEKIVFSNKFEDGFFFDIDSFNSTTIPFIALKGATVTQEASK